MYKISLLWLGLFVGAIAHGQFKNDNVAYKTVDPADLCTMLEKNKGYLLLDVRTPEEFVDTAAFAGYNLGHFKGAKNIPVQDLGKRIAELKAFKNQPLFVYCSHSQRSRRASKMLADSGFTKVFNINGGMTAFHYSGTFNKPCVKALWQSSIGYSLITANDLCRINDNMGVIIDVRSDSAFRHISYDAKENAIGIIDGSVNIPLEQMKKGPLNIPAGKDANIILVDIYGGDAATAGALLVKNGYKHVHVMIEGIDRYLYTDKKDITCKLINYISPVKYKLMTAGDFGAFVNKTNGYVLVDVRTPEEFNNTHKDYYRNIGHLKGAVNIPITEMDAHSGDLERYKNSDAELILYSFGSGKDLFEAANEYERRGFQNFTVLYGGIFSIRWTAGNVKGQSRLKDLVVDIPAANQ